jgi:hypothetical protein
MPCRPALRDLATLCLASGVALGGSLGCNENVEADEPEDVRRAEEFVSEEVRAVLDAADRAVETRGFSRSGDEWRGFLVEHETLVHEAPLRAGSCTIVVGVGSRALVELDLRLYDSDGSAVAEDATRGNGSALRYCPPHTGMHYLAVLATAGDGLYAARRFDGPTGLDVPVDDLFEGARPEGRETAERP